MPDLDWAGAHWWWPAGAVEPLQYADFACDLDLGEDPAQAWIALSSGSWFTLWVDGRWLAHGPPREVAPWQYYEVVDLRGMLHHGRNRLRIRVWHIGLPTQFHEPCLAGLLLRGQAGGVDLGERGRWRCAIARRFLPDAPHLHHCAGYGEHVDLGDDPQRWLTTDADPRWEPPAEVAAHPLPGRERLIPSDLPPFAGATFTARPIGRRGTWQVWDFSQEVFGFLSLDGEAAGPTTCDLLQGESLGEDGLPDHRYSGGDFRDRLEFPAGRRAWESFEKRALRYVAMPEGVVVHRLAVREHHRDLREVWRGRELDPRDRAIVATAARTVILCCDDLLNDCPRRERSQYSDPAAYMAAFPLLFGTWEPVRRWLRQYLRGAGPDGKLRMCYPSPPGMGVIPDFSLAFAGTLKAYLDGSGDVETVRLAFPAALAGVAGFAGSSDAQGLLTDVPGWVFLCNSFEVAKHPRSSGLNALWAAAWDNLGLLAQRLGDDRADGFRARGRELRAAWRRTFLRDGLILDADSSPQHQSRRWWNYHVDADRGHFAPGASAVVITVPWTGPVRRLALAAAGRVRAWSGNVELLNQVPANPWSFPHPFAPWECDFPGGELRIELEPNGVDWEIYLAGDGGEPGQAQCEGRATAFRPWSAPRWSQITTGYAVDSGMLDAEEAKTALCACVREHYHVPWLKRTTPIICTPTADRRLIDERAVLCNTPQSLSFFCRALRDHGMAEEARTLCRRIYGAQLDAGATSLWEEFAPRSSLCHAWAAMCVEHLLA